MTRQILINELQKLQIEKKENKNDILNEVYIFQKYPYLKILFDQHKKNEKSSERWHQLVRETLFADIQSIRYMYDRTIQLIRRIGKNPKLFFKIKTEIGTYTMPDRLSDLNRLMGLFEEFFCNILPGLIKKLSIEILSEEHKEVNIRGKIQWNKTINDRLNSGLIQTPWTFNVIRPTTRFDTPENILLLLSAMRMKYDASFLLMSRFTDPLTPFEINQLEKIAEGCNCCMNLPILKELIPETRKYLFLELDDARILSLELKVHSRTEEASPQNKLIRALIRWRRTYRELQLRVVSKQKTHFPLDHIENLDTMYELWILFEILNFFKEKKFTINILKFPREFEIEKSSKKFTFYYEKWYKGWSSVGAHPDFTVEIEGKLIAVLDAKNWLIDDKKKAIYKMLGYINNLDVSTGILFFPTKSQLGDTRIHYGTAEMKYHKSQCLYNCVLFPSSTSEGYLNNMNNLDNFLNIIINRL